MSDTGSALASLRALTFSLGLFSNSSDSKIKVRFVSLLCFSVGKARAGIVPVKMAIPQTSMHV